MGKVLEFRKPAPNREIVIPDELRTYDQCRILQEHAFHMRKYYEIMMVDRDSNRCFVWKTTRDIAASQIAMRNGGIMPPEFG